MSPNYLFARQTPQPLAPNLRQPTAAIALSTTFTPPASCALPSQINILPSPGFLIWWNEPVPYSSVTVSDCYPSEFLRSYTSIAPTSARALGSSIVPAMSPLVCPENFCTQYVGDNNYVACCPTGYNFQTTGTPVVASRPAYGGICYTNIPISQELTAVVYDSTGSAHQEIWAPSTTGAQGWAHPIDGWAPSKPVIGCGTKALIGTLRSSASSRRTTADRSLSSASASTQSLTVSSSVSSAKKKTSGGVIAGAVLGALVALAAILGLVLLLLRRRKRASQVTAAGEQKSRSDDGTLYQTDGSQIHQKDGDDARVEVNAAAAPTAPAELGSNGTTTAELGPSKNANAHELGTGPYQVSELPAGNDGRANQR